jgi:two-component system cell cycle sensor histidine kinase/response regulator CckA
MTLSNPTAPETRHESAGLRLARICVGPGCSMYQALQELAEVSTEALQVNRLSIWRFLDRRSAISCEFLWQATNGAISEGAILHARDFPGYFGSLEVRRVVRIVDVNGHPLTEEFREPYFRPLGITSMLDAPIYCEGELAGVVCHEQIGPARRWTDEDCAFAATVADVIARLHQEGARVLAEDELNTYRARLANLQRLEVLGRLAAGAAHDFRNVLQAIAGYAEEIAEAAGGERRITTLTTDLLKSVDRGASLARELQLMGREEPARPRVTALEEVVASARDMLEKAVGPDVTIDTCNVVPAGKVFIDPERMERVLLNLVLNARDAMPAGGMIAVAVAGSAQGRHVVLSVSDPGTGMDETTRRRIFEPLFTTKGDRGTGLGVPIVNQIVTEAGGFIEVDSAVGRGTVFRLHFPRIG